MSSSAGSFLIKERTNTHDSKTKEGSNSLIIATCLSRCGRNCSDIIALRPAACLVQKSRNSLNHARDFREMCILKSIIASNVA